MSRFCESLERERERERKWEEGILALVALWVREIVFNSAVASLVG